MYFFKDVIYSTLKLFQNQLLGGCQSTLELVRHLSQSLISECGLTEEESRVPLVNCLEERFNSLQAKTRDREQLTASRCSFTLIVYLFHFLLLPILKQHFLLINLLIYLIKLNLAKYYYLQFQKMCILKYFIHCRCFVFIKVDRVFNII